MNIKFNILPEEIKILLNKYYEGTTSLEEERKLKTYFNVENIPEDYYSDKTIFSFKRSNELSILPENELWNKINEHAKKKKNSRRTIRVITSMAASLLVLFTFSTWYFISSKKQSNLTYDTCSNPEEAYRIAQKYLGFASHKLSYAYNEIKPIRNLAIPSEAMQPFSEINKNLEHLNQLETINKSTSSLEHLAVFNDIVNVDKNL